MQRGIRTLFPDMVIVPVKKAGVGRNPRLVQLRNECLLHRYLFIHKTCRWDYPMLIKAIAAEFWLSEETVKEIISENAMLIKSIRTQLNDVQFSADTLSSRYPHFNWNTPVLEHYM